jgi:hypothetical protein
LGGRNREKMSDKPAFTKYLKELSAVALRGDAREQYALTRALLVHEAGHRRFTSPGGLNGVAALVANCLEDERVERLMSDGFAGLRPLDARSESPGQVLAAVLMARWAERVGEALKGKLSEANQGRLELVLPLAREA